MHCLLTLTDSSNDSLTSPWEHLLPYTLFVQNERIATISKTFLQLTQEHHLGASYAIRPEYFRVTAGFPHSLVSPVYPTTSQIVRVFPPQTCS